MCFLMVPQLAAQGTIFRSFFKLLTHHSPLILYTFMVLKTPDAQLEIVQDFLIKLGIKPLMRLVEMSILSPNFVIFGLIKIMNYKHWVQFQKIKYSKNQNFQKKVLINIGLLHKNLISERFNQFLTHKNDFENTNFEMFQDVVHNFGKFDLVKKCFFSTRCIHGFMPT